MRISDWSSDVCSSDLVGQQIRYVRRVDIDPRRHCALASDAVPVVEQALQPFATDGVAEDRHTPVEGLSRPRGFTARVRTVNRFRAFACRFARLGAPGRTRTSTVLPPTVFESAASTNSATGASGRSEERSVGKERASK